MNILQNITKNEAFRLYFQHTDDSGTDAPGTIEDPLVTYTEISKDGGIFTPTTNSIVQIDGGQKGNGYIDLTLSEMNADNIIVKIRVMDETEGLPGNQVGIIDTIIIYTGTVSGGGGGDISMNDVIANQSDLPNGDLTVRQVFELIAKRLKRFKGVPKI